MNKGNISMQNPRWINKRTKLPQVLINIVWEYDGRYKKLFKECVQELGRYFDHSRMLNRIHGEMRIYEVYLLIRDSRRPTPISRYGKRTIPFSKYILSRITQYHGDLVPNNNLCPYNLRRMCNHVRRPIWTQWTTIWATIT